MNRFELQQLAQIRLTDAKALLATGENDAGAYYMAGYAIECALKAVIAKNQGIQAYQFPEAFHKEQYYSHNIKLLTNTAKLVDILKQARKINATLDGHWTLVESWNETYRYQIRVPRATAEQLIFAILDDTNGVLQWLKNYW